MTHHDPQYQHRLREQVLQRIRDDWTTYFSRHGKQFVDFASIESQNGFLEDIADVIETELIRQVGPAEAKELAPSKYFYRRFFQYNPSERWQKRTRHALCLYVGYTDWDAFVQACKPVSLVTNESLEKPDELGQKTVLFKESALPPRRPVWLSREFLSALFALIAGLGVWAVYSQQTYKANPVTFTIIRVHGQSAPVTLEFQYNISARTYRQAVVQVRLKAGKLIEEVPLERSAGNLLLPLLHSGVRAIQLVVDGTVVREVIYVVKTNGWIGRIVDHGQSYPIISGAQLRQNGSLYIPPPAVLRANGDANFQLFFSNCRNFGIRGDEAVLEFRARNSPDDGGLICNTILAHMEDGGTGQVGVDFIRPGCTGFASLYLNDRVFNARNDAPLALALGQDTHQWATYRISVAKRRIRAYRNNAFLFERPCPGAIDTLTHLSFQFKGAGRLDWVRLTDANTGRVAYQEDF